MNYLVSVIVPVYNSAQYLKRCLTSLVNQTLKQTQIILVNDGSTDESVNILDEFARAYSNIEVIHQENQGASSARNTGMRYVKGQYVGFVDADDYVEVNMFEIMYQGIVESQAQMAICSYNTLKGISHFERAVMNVTESTTAEIYVRYIAKSPVLWNKLFEYQLVKGLKFDKDMKMGEDLLFNTLAYQKIKRIVAVDEVLYFYDDNPNSITHSTGVCDYKDMIKSYCKDVSSCSEDLAIYQMLTFLTGFLFSTVMNGRSFRYVYKAFSDLAENKKREMIQFLYNKRYQIIYRHDAISKKLYYAYKIIFFFEVIKLRSVSVGGIWVLSKLIRIR